MFPAPCSKLLITSLALVQCWRLAAFDMPVTVSQQIFNVCECSLQAIKPPVRAIEKALTCYEGDVSRLLDGEGNQSLRV
jgi:hypothetical protein